MIVILVVLPIVILVGSIVMLGVGAGGAGCKFTMNSVYYVK